MKTLRQFLYENSDALVSFSDYPLEQRFNTFNHLYFNGEIPEIPVTWGKTGQATGITQYSVEFPPGQRPRMKIAWMQAPNGTIFKKLRITINNLRAPIRREWRWDGVLIHEMIHAWLCVNRYIFENHGHLFQQKAHEIAAKYGRAIPLKDEFDAEELAHAVGKPVVAMLFLKTAKEGSNADTVYGLLTPSWKDKAAELKEYAMKRMTGWHHIHCYYIPSSVKATFSKLNRTLPLDRYSFRTLEDVKAFMGECKAGTLLWSIDVDAVKKSFFG